jgi:FixJ family two-component response regulator
MQHQTESFSQFLKHFSEKHSELVKSLEQVPKAELSNDALDKLVQFLQSIQRELNQYSIFEVSLICTQLEKSCVAVKNNQDKDGHSLSFLTDTFSQLPSFLKGMSHSKTMSENQSHSDKQLAPLIYIVDDEPMLLELFEAMLEAMPVRIKTFNNPEKVIDDFLFDRPSLILSDMKMPEMTGTDLLKKVRALDQAVSFIFISGYINKDNVIEFMNLGVYGVVEKPFKAPQVLSLVEKALKNYQILSNYNKSLEKALLISHAEGTNEIKTLIDEVLNNRKNLFQFA